MAVAAIDCGTNSIRLLITEGGVDRVRELRIVRLGQGVDSTGRLDPAAIERTRLALAEYRTLIDAHHVTRLRMVATSATRDADNAADFHTMVQSTLGHPAEVITGSQEAELSFTGAITGLPSGTEYLIVDIGGGSTEFVRGTTHVHASESVNVGTVRIYERHLHHDPPTADELAAATNDIAAAVQRGLQNVAGQPVTLIGVAGAVTTIAAVHAHLKVEEPAALHHTRLTARAIETVAEILCSMNHAQRAAIAAIHPGRVDVIMGGALILRETMRQTHAPDIIVSERDLLDGIAASIA